MGEIFPSSAVRSARAFPATTVDCTGPGSIAVRFAGELDAVGAPELESTLQGVWSRGIRRVTIDLSDVTFLGLAGLHALVRIRSTAQRRGVHLAVAGASQHVYRLLGMAGAGDVVELAASTGPAAGVGPLPTEAGPELATTLRALRWTSTDPTGNLPDALRSVTETAAAYLPGVEGAGVLLVAGPGRLVSHAETDPVVTILDLVQQRSRSGPAWDSAWTGVDVVVDDLDDDPRWPDVVAETAGLGVRSLLCLRLGDAGQPRGALTVYSSAPTEFPPVVQRLGHAFAAIAAVALSADRVGVDLWRGADDRDERPDVSSVRARCLPARGRGGRDVDGFAAAGES